MPLDLYIKMVEGKGRGVFCNDDIAAGDVIEFCPVIIIPADQQPHLDQTKLYDYYFLWGEDQLDMALALGFGSLYNHDYKPNAGYETFYEDKVIVIRALCNIEAHTEICISYNQDPENKRKVWFED